MIETTQELADLLGVSLVEKTDKSEDRTESEEPVRLFLARSVLHPSYDIAPQLYLAFANNIELTLEYEKWREAYKQADAKREAVKALGYVTPYWLPLSCP